MEKRLLNWKRCLQISSIALVVLIVLQLFPLNTLPINVYMQHRNIVHVENASNCSAIDWSNPRFCTPLSNNTAMYGIPFNISSNLLRDIGLPMLHFEVLQRRNLNDFVFVTAADANYFHFAMDAIANVQSQFPNHSIYFYDLNSNSLQNVASKVERLCNVIYRKFNFSRYPSHMNFLKNYAFKPVVVHVRGHEYEMLTEFSRVFWMDSSVRFNTGNLSLTLDEVYASGGILTFERSIHSNFAATHSGMYRYLPISASDASNTVQYGANSIYIHRNELLYNRVIAWWVLCALENNCIAPTLQLKCNFKPGRPIDQWAGCHRFDQAALNILMAHHFKYDVAKYTSHRGQLGIHRYVAHQGQLILCPNRTGVKSAVYFS